MSFGVPKTLSLIINCGGGHPHTRLLTWYMAADFAAQHEPVGNWAGREHEKPQEELEFERKNLGRPRASDADRAAHPARQHDPFPPLQHGISHAYCFAIHRNGSPSQAP